MPWRDRSFEVLPALRLRGPALRSALRTVTVAWMFGIVWMSCIAGSQMTVFCRLLGFRNYHFGILAAIPFAATLAQLYTAVVIERTGLRKYMFIYFAGVHRALWLVIALIPLLVPPGPGAVGLFLGTFALTCVLAHISNPPWYDWMGSLIPRRIRGRYFATRALWTLPVQMVVVAATGIVLDRLTLPLPEGTGISIHNQPGLARAICAIFAVGAVFGTIDILLFLRLREIASPALGSAPAPAPAGNRLRALAETIVEPFRLLVASFRDRVFSHYALYGAVIAFSISVSDQFFYVNALEKVGLGKLGTNVAFMVFGAGSSMLMSRPWGALIDRWGRRPVLILATIGIVFSPFGWFLMRPGDLTTSYVLAVLSCMVGGATWSAVNLGQTNIILGFSETTGRSRYVAAAAAVTAIGGLLGGISGGVVAEAFRDLPMYVGPFTWNGYHVTFLVSCAARAAAILLLIGMPDPGARPLRDVVRVLWFNAYSNVTTRLFWPLRTRRGP